MFTESADRGRLYSGGIEEEIPTGWPNNVPFTPTAPLINVFLKDPRYPPQYPLAYTKENPAPTMRGWNIHYYSNNTTLQEFMEDAYYWSHQHYNIPNLDITNLTGYINVQNYVDIGNWDDPHNEKVSKYLMDVVSVV